MLPTCSVDHRADRCGVGPGIYDRNHQQWTVSVTVTDAAESRFDKGIRQNVGRDVAIVIDGEVVDAPRVNAGITGRYLEISGNFDEQTAERIAAGLTNGRVQLTPPSKDAHPTFSLAEAFGHLPISGFTYSAGIYDVVLANWTSDAGLVLESNGKPAPHEHVLAWVVIGKHVPVAASDIDSPTTVPGVPCYFGTSIAAVDATTGRGIADASDYSG